MRLTYQDIASEFNISVTTVLNLVDEHISVSKIPLPEYLSIDEIYAKKLTKYKYCCVLYSSSNKKIIEILNSRRKNYLLDFFLKIPMDERKTVKYVSIDMWDTYKSVVLKCLPNAVIAVDSFHIIKNLYSFFDKIRKRVMNKYLDYKYQNDYRYWLLKKHNYYLKKDISKLPEYKYFTKFKMRLSKYQVIDYMLELDQDLKTAYELKEEYRNFNLTANINSCEEWLDDLIKKFSLCKIPEYFEFYKMIKKWRKEIINSFIIYKNRRLSNSQIERLNLTIKNYKNVSFGLRNFERMRKRVIFSVNEDTPLKF